MTMQDNQLKQDQNSMKKDISIKISKIIGHSITSNIEELMMKWMITTDILSEKLSPEC